MFLRYCVYGALLLGLSACGFHLRGLQQELPFKAVSVSGDSELARLLRQQIEQLQGTRLNTDPKAADAEIAILKESLDRRIISLTRGGKVAEYQLRYLVDFAVYGAYKEVLQAPAQIELRRDFPYDGQQTLAKEAEERQLVDHLRQQAIETVLRQVSALHNQNLQAPGK